MEVKQTIVRNIELTKEDRATLEKLSSFFTEFVTKLDNTFYFKGAEDTVYNIDDVYRFVNFLDDFTTRIEEWKW